MMIQQCEGYQKKDELRSYLPFGLPDVLLWKFCGVPEWLEPFWFGGKTRGKPNFKYVYIFDPNVDLIQISLINYFLSVIIKTIITLVHILGVIISIAL